MQVNDMICGFRVDRCRDSAELNGKLWEMTHEKTGAQLVWLDNGEDNKVFSVAFKTIPYDSTGVFHIIEHSVLCGSENFPVKEPFLDLIKSSMNTFLNAMTFQDKTMYPVSSRNEQDYINLTRVYLDAVFFPAIHKNPSIFYQEGWHYELGDSEAAPVYKGVVFNEMKGAVSSVDSQINYAMRGLLYPDSIYRHNSGGDPKCIPSLTYDAFKKAHRTFYHPSNSKIYLDGNVPLERVLKLISDDYLNKFERNDEKHEIGYQTPVAGSKKTYYAIGKEESEEGKTHIALAKIIADWNERKKITAASVLGSYLASSNEAPLQRAVLESGLAKDMVYYVDDGILQPFFMLQIRNTEEKHKDAIRDIIRSTIKRLISEGLDKEELSAIISRLEFAAKDDEEPRGINRAINALSSWLYDGDPIDYLENDAIIAELRREIDGDYYEKLLSEMFLDETFMCEVTLMPSRTKGEEDEAAEKARLADAAASWSAEERESVVRLNAELEKWQCSVDTPEAVATLPTLSISDVSDKPEWIDTEICEADGVKLLYHKLSTSGIVHCNMYFSLADLKLEELQTLAFMSQLLGELPTKNYTALKLQRSIKHYIGKIDYDVEAFAVNGSRDSCRPYFVVSFSALEEYAKEACALVVEIVKNTDYSATSQVKEILLQCVEHMNRSFISSGHRFAVTRAMSSFSLASTIAEKIGGYDYYRYINELSGSFDSISDSFAELSGKLAAKVFTRSRLTLGETAATRCGDIDAMVSQLDNGSFDGNEIMTQPVKETLASEAIIIPSGVSYAAMCSELDACNAAFDPSLSLLSTILSYGYLWNEIRVRGGAYGCGFSARETGELLFHSFRDPSPAHSIDVYGDTASFIRSFVESGESIEKYIISTIARQEPLMAPARKGSLAESRYFSGIKYEDKLQLRRGVLALRSEDLLKQCVLFETMVSRSSRCVIGNESAIDALGDGYTKYRL